MILALVEKGFRVGVTAVSHKVIRNLLDEVRSAAAAEGRTIRTGQKPKERSAEPPFGIEEEPDNKKFAQRLKAGAWDVAGATSWFWARSEARDSVHTLFVDEAGQMSLASTLASSPAARNLVLLGDPQQLDQPQKAIHPDGIDVSALAHLLEGEATMPRERGLFLSDTWRLAPPICALTSELFYRGKLKPRQGAGLERQWLAGTDGLNGAGLWWRPVEHQGRSTYSPEEIEVVKAVVARLLQPAATWRDRHGEDHPLRGDDVLVVAPYNAHVTRLDERLRARGVRVGTVDKFQGQEAPVVIYTMATSSAEDAPRGMEFLLSLNRFNVATSRARCTVISSPRPVSSTPNAALRANCNWRTPCPLRGAGEAIGAGSRLAKAISAERRARRSAMSSRTTAKPPSGKLSGFSQNSARPPSPHFSYIATLSRSWSLSQTLTSRASRVCAAEYSSERSAARLPNGAMRSAKAAVSAVFLAPGGK